MSTASGRGNRLSLYIMGALRRQLSVTWAQPHMAVAASPILPGEQSAPFLSPKRRLKTYSSTSSRSLAFSETRCVIWSVPGVTLIRRLSLIQLHSSISQCSFLTAVRPACLQIRPSSPFTRIISVANTQTIASGTLPPSSTLTMPSATRKTLVSSVSAQSAAVVAIKRKSP